MWDKVILGRVYWAVYIMWEIVLKYWNMAIGSKFIVYMTQLSIVMIFTGGLSNSRNRDMLTGNGLYVVCPE